MTHLSRVRHNRGCDTAGSSDSNSSCRSNVNTVAVQRYGVHHVQDRIFGKIPLAEAFSASTKHHSLTPELPVQRLLVYVPCVCVLVVGYSFWLLIVGCWLVVVGVGCWLVLAVVCYLHQVTRVLFRVEFFLLALGCHLNKAE
jgi:hypothetical protein